ncbi:MAG: MoaD/ThiS family protein [Treponema sp.]|nr:MoaD/ThiS family protein [Treponema sp.]
MCNIHVKYRGSIADLTGTKEESFKAGNVRDVLKAIRKRYGRNAEKAARTMLIALNGESILLLKGYKTTLKEDDTLSFFPLSAGG